MSASAIETALPHEPPPPASPDRGPRMSEKTQRELELIQAFNRVWSEFDAVPDDQLDPLTKAEREEMRSEYPELIGAGRLSRPSRNMPVHALVDYGLKSLSSPDLPPDQAQQRAADMKLIEDHSYSVLYKTKDRSKLDKAQLEFLKTYRLATGDEQADLTTARSRVNLRVRKLMVNGSIPKSDGANAFAALGIPSKTGSTPEDPNGNGSGPVDAAKGALGSAADAARQGVERVAETAQDLAGKVVETPVGQAVQGAVDSASQAGQTLVDKASQAAQGLADKASQTPPGEAVKSAVDSAAQAGQTLVDKAGQAAQGLASAAGEAVSQATGGGSPEGKLTTQEIEDIREELSGDIYKTASYIETHALIMSSQSGPDKERSHQSIKIAQEILAELTGNKEAADQFTKAVIDLPEAGLKGDKNGVRAAIDKRDDVLDQLAESYDQKQADSGIPASESSSLDGDQSTFQIDISEVESLDFSQMDANAALSAYKNLFIADKKLTDPNDKEIVQAKLKEAQERLTDLTGDRHAVEAANQKLEALYSKADANADTRKEETEAKTAFDTLLHLAEQRSLDTKQIEKIMLVLSSEDPAYEFEARRLADQRVNLDLEAPGIRNLVKRVSTRIKEKGLREQYARQIKEALIEAKNPYATVDLYKLKVTDPMAAKSTYDNDRLDTAQSIASMPDIGASEIASLPQQIERDFIRMVVMEAISSNLSEEDISHKVDDFVEVYRSDLIKAFGDKVDPRKLVPFFSSNLYEQVQSINESIRRHNIALNQLDQIVDIRVALPNWGPNGNIPDEQLGRMEQAIHKLQQTRPTGLLSNPVVLGALSSTGLYAGLTRIGMRTLAPWAGLAGGLGIGGFVAYHRRGKDFTRDRIQANKDYAVSEESGKNGERRKELLKYAYSAVLADELLEGGPQARGSNGRGINELLSQDLSVEANRIALVVGASEIIARLQYGLEKNINLIRFSSRQGAQSSKADLIRAVAEAKIALRRAGVTEAELNESIKDQVEFRYRIFDREVAAKDEEFQADKDQKKRDAAKEALIKGAVGAAVIAGALVLAGPVIAGAAATVAPAIRSTLYSIPEAGKHIEQFGEKVFKPVSDGISHHFTNAARILGFQGERVLTGGTGTSGETPINVQTAGRAVAFSDIANQGDASIQGAAEDVTRGTYGARPFPNGPVIETPSMTRWVEGANPNTRDLVERGTGRILLNEARIVNGQLEAAGGMLADQIVNDRVDGGRTETSRRLFGRNGLWNEHSIRLDEGARNWMTNGTRGHYDGRELGLHINGDRDTIELKGPRGTDAFYFSTGGHPDNVLRVPADENGVAILERGGRNRDIFRMVIDNQELRRNGVSTEILALCRDGEHGLLEAVNERGNGKVNVLATVQGSGDHKDVIRMMTEGKDRFNISIGSEGLNAPENGGDSREDNGGSGDDRVNPRNVTATNDRPLIDLSGIPEAPPLIPLPTANRYALEEDQPEPAEEPTPDDNGNDGPISGAGLAAGAAGVTLPFIASHLPSRRRPSSGSNPESNGRSAGIQPDGQGPVRPEDQNPPSGEQPAPTQEELRAIVIQRAMSRQPAAQIQEELAARGVDISIGEIRQMRDEAGIPKADDPEFESKLEKLGVPGFERLESSEGFVQPARSMVTRETLTQAELDKRKPEYIQLPEGGKPPKRGKVQVTEVLEAARVIHGTKFDKKDAITVMSASQPGVVNIVVAHGDGLLPDAAPKLAMEAARTSMHDGPLSPNVLASAYDRIQSVDLVQIARVQELSQVVPAGLAESIHDRIADGRISEATLAAVQYDKSNGSISMALSGNAEVVIIRDGNISPLRGGASKQRSGLKFRQDLIPFQPTGAELFKTDQLKDKDIVIISGQELSPDLRKEAEKLVQKNDPDLDKKLANLLKGKSPTPSVVLRHSARFEQLNSSVSTSDSQQAAETPSPRPSSSHVRRMEQNSGKKPSLGDRARGVIGGALSRGNNARLRLEEQRKRTNQGNRNTSLDSRTQESVVIPEAVKVAPVAQQIPEVSPEVQSIRTSFEKSLKELTPDQQITLRAFRNRQKDNWQNAVLQNLLGNREVTDAYNRLGPGNEFDAVVDRAVNAYLQDQRASYQEQFMKGTSEAQARFVNGNGGQIPPYPLRIIDDTSRRETEALNAGRYGDTEDAESPTPAVQPVTPQPLSAPTDPALNSLSSEASVQHGNHTNPHKRLTLNDVANYVADREHELAGSIDSSLPSNRAGKAAGAAAKGILGLSQIGPEAVARITGGRRSRNNGQKPNGQIFPAPASDDQTSRE